MNEFFKYLRTIYRRRYLYVALAILITGAFLIWAYGQPNQYRADSTVFIEKNVISDLVKGIAVTPDMGDRIRVLRQAILSRDLISKVLNDLDLGLRGNTDRERQDMVSALQNRTMITVKGSELFTISIVDSDPAFAQDYVNTLVRKYVEENISGKRQETYGANRFFDEQLVHFKRKLDEAEDAIIRFRREEGVFPLINEESLLKEIADYRKEIEGIDLTVETGRSKIRRLQTQLQEISPTIAVFSEQQKENQLLKVEDQMRRLLLNYTEQHPEMQRLRMEAEDLRQRLVSDEAPADMRSLEMTMVNPLYQDTRQKLLEAEAEISALEGRRRLLQQLKEEKETSLQTVPESRKISNVLVQERDSLRKIHEELLVRLGQSEVSKQMEIGDKTTTFRIVDPAVFPTYPVSPNLSLLILLALGAGIGGAFVCVLLVDNLNVTIGEAQQLRNLGMEVLAIIPIIDDEVQTRRRKRLDILAYTTAGVYVVGVLGLYAVETFKPFS